MHNGFSTIEAILFENIDVDPEASDDEAADACNAGLREVLSKEGLTIHEHGSGKLAANDKGKTMFDRLSALELENSAVKATLALHEDTRIANEGYQNIRSRFLSCYKRKIGVEKPTGQVHHCRGKRSRPWRGCALMQLSKRVSSAATTTTLRVCTA